MDGEEGERGGGRRGNADVFPALNNMEDLKD